MVPLPQPLPPFFPHSPFESADLAQKRPREISHSTKLDSGGTQQRQRGGWGGPEKRRAVNMYPTEKKRIEQKQSNHGLVLRPGCFSQT